VNEVEDALIRRLDVRHAIATKLTPRQRDIVRLYYRGCTGDEVGAAHNIGRARAHQIYCRAERTLNYALVESRPPREPVAEIKQRFDRAAFLDHMRFLIRQREQRKAREIQRKREREAALFEQECANVERMLEHERARKSGVWQPKPPPLKLPDPLFASYYPKAPPPPYVAPVAPPPIDINELAPVMVRGLSTFTHLLNLSDPGKPTLGEYSTSVTFGPWGSITTAAERLARSLPPAVHLSAYEWPLLEGQRGVIASNAWAALRLVVDGQKLRLEVTWDYA
jgi:hypothetical protein